MEVAPAKPGEVLIATEELVPAGVLAAEAIEPGGSQPRGEMPDATAGGADWLGPDKPGGRDGLVRVPGEEAMN